MKTRFGAVAAAVLALTALPLLAQPAGADSGAPSAPTGLVAQPGDRSVTLTWGAPTDDGGSPILGYLACAHWAPPNSGSNCTEVGPEARAATVTQLWGGRHYEFSVQAETATTLGDYAVAQGDLATSAPEHPNSVTAQASARRLTVTGAVPWWDGGSPVTGYVACATPDPAVSGATPTCATATGPTVTIDGLTPGRTYAATLAATNAIGTGAAASAPEATFVYDVPGAIPDLTGTAGDHAAGLAWSPPDDGGTPITGYEVAVVGATPNQGPWPLASGGQPSFWMPGLEPGRPYTFTVTAQNAGGDGPTASVTVVPTRDAAAYAPFSSWDEFVAQQLEDTTGKRGTNATRSVAVAALAAGTTTPEAYVASLLAGSSFQRAVPPVVRLYLAYFGRVPDPAGLRSWSSHRRDGTTLIRVSSTFAGSSEFRRSYGSPSNAGFVDLVYQNVLGRPADAGGRAYWITKLNRGTPRGQLMVTFSESAEFVRKTQARVDVIGPYETLLDRAPSTPLVAEWQARPTTALLPYLLRSDVYFSNHR